MKPNLYPHRTALALAAAFVLLLASSAQAALVHRYSFNEAGGTTVEDSVGTADGIIKGNGAYFDGTNLQLPGQSNSADPAETIGGYVDLPNGIIRVLTNATFETWVTWWGSSAWERIFDLGTSGGGEDISDGNGNYLFLSPAGASFLRFAIRDPATQIEHVQLTDSAALAYGTETCVTVTYDANNNVCRLFTNGLLAVVGTAVTPLNTINDVNNWLGRSQWGDAMFQGGYNEFRIYDHALNPVEVAASYVAGVTTPNSNPSVLGDVQAVHLTVLQTSMTADDEQGTSATADFAQKTGVSLASVPDATYSSSNPNVVTIDSKGLIKAVEGGAADVTLTYGGKTDTVGITVTPRQTGIAVAGTLHVDLRAPDASGDPTVWQNRTGLGDFYAGYPTENPGTPAYVADVQGTGLPGVQFDGGFAYVGPLAPADITGISDRSIEVWAYNPALADEETLVAWSHRGFGLQNMSFNYGANATWGAVGHWDADVGWNGSPAPAMWHYLVYTYDGAVVRVYADGVFKNQRTVALNTFPDDPIRLGAQANTSASDFDFGQALSGFLSTVRVHGGTLSANDIKNNYLYGAELTPPGDLLAIDLTLDADTLIGAGTTAQGTVKADYANRKYLYVTQLSTFASSKPEVATVDTNGTVVAVGLGSTDITASYGGKSATKSLQVLLVPPPKLAHRYSFGESPSATTVTDSIGSANGVVKGNGATFDGQGKLTLPGGGSSAADPATIAGYVDLPNGIISRLVDTTIEAWVTWNGPESSWWQRIFDFGTSAGGEDVSDGNGAYLYASPQNSGGRARFAVRDPLTGIEPVVLDWTQRYPIGTEVHIALVYDQRNNTSLFYSNAVQAASGPASVPLKSINDVNNWLGRSQWGDDMFSGTYNEFRIWDGALAASDIAASYAAGPDALPGTEKPSVTIILAPTGVTIGWPSATTGYTLESKVSLDPGSWTTVDTSGAVEQGGQMVITLPIEGTSKYYRLKK